MENGEDGAGCGRRGEETEKQRLARHQEEERKGADASCTVVYCGLLGVGIAAGERARGRCQTANRKRRRGDGEGASAAWHVVRLHTPGNLS